MSKFIIVVLLVFLAGIGSLVFFNESLLISAAKNLIHEETPSKCDAAIILAGEFPNRAIATGDYYNERLFKYVIIPNEIESSGDKELKKRNLPFRGVNQIIPDLLLAMGVSKEALIPLENPTDRTIEEALEVKKLLYKHDDIKCLAIVTSRYHSKRAFVIFSNVFKDEKIEIKSFTPTFDDYKPENWWKRPRFIRNTVNEYLKFLVIPFNKNN